MESTREIVPFRPRLRADVVELWNQVFQEQHRFTRLDRVQFQRIIEVGHESDPFIPELFLVAMEHDRVCGFVHGGIWRGAFLERLFPDVAAEAVGYLALVAVAPWCRRKGWGRALLRALRSQLQSEFGIQEPLRADGRVFNPFYGNFLGPRAPLWGTTEGIAVRADDSAARAFFQDQGFGERQQASSLRVELSARSLPEPIGSAGVEFAHTSDYQPILGTIDGMSFPVSNNSETWVAVIDERQLASVVAYPLGSSEWGIHSLEVHEDARGRGIGARLLDRMLSELERRGVERVETLVLPIEAPAAARLYEKAGFREVCQWVVVE